MEFLRSLTGRRAQAPSVATPTAMDHSEEMIAEVDEPPDEQHFEPVAMWQPSQLDPQYAKSQALPYQRRESLLTRQLHSETEHTDEEIILAPDRAHSTGSTWSSRSTTSIAELTSDDGRSVPSPAISPPLSPTQVHNALPATQKPLDHAIEVVGHDEMPALVEKETSSEKSVEAGLGRKRCISFACGRKDAAAKPMSPTLPTLRTTDPSPPKRRCALKFVCPSESASDAKLAAAKPARRSASPPPSNGEPLPVNRPGVGKAHRGSDSTVVRISPKRIRKSPSITPMAATPTRGEAPKQVPVTAPSNDSDDSGAEATRFHEFATSDDEPEEWTQQLGCHRNRLTVDDTLQKESVIRKACEEVEEEVVEEDEEEEEQAEAEELAGKDVDDDEDGEEDGEEEGVDGDERESVASDAGFHSDDEDGFAASDSEGEESDFEWWKPGGSTAATSVDHLDRLIITPKPRHVEAPPSSLGSVSSGRISPRSSRQLHHKRTHRLKRSPAISINKPADPELPDSTDFVCGTLDEDRPIEQAYINRKKQMEATKHKARPQDIDPSFPASDPEMDEEDDDDLIDPVESEHEGLMHGEMEEFQGTAQAHRRRPSPPPLRRTTSRRSPPASRAHSPPPSKIRGQYHSPPPPTGNRRAAARSPPPRKLFGQSPRRMPSPAPIHRMTSPPNTRHSSFSREHFVAAAAPGLASRPQLTHTASLPRGGFLISKMGAADDADATDATEIPKRGAIDIFKGLEKKRQRRKEKLYQKACAKAAAKGEKAYKVKPGRGAERMREVGLELQKYQGKGAHILSL